MIIMHHLRVGRAIFTTAFLEELGVDYELRLYTRNDNFRAPAELKDAHPLGKSPVIEDKGMTIAESGAITAYLIDNYDTGGKFAPAKENYAEWMRFQQWLHYSEGSMSIPLLLNLLLRREDPTPPIFSGFAARETKLHLSYLETTLAGNDYIMGSDFSGADVGCGYVANAARQLKLLDDYPMVKAYAKRITERPAFLQAFSKTGG